MIEIFCRKAEVKKRRFWGWCSVTNFVVKWSQKDESFIEREDSNTV